MFRTTCLFVFSVNIFIDVKGNVLNNFGVGGGWSLVMKRALSELVACITCHKLLPEILCQIHPQWASAETHLKTIVIHAGKWTGRGCLFQTLERLIITKIPGSTQILESVFCTFKVLWTLHSTNDLLDSLTVFVRNLHHM